MYGAFIRWICVVILKGYGWLHYNSYKKGNNKGGYG